MNNSNSPNRSIGFWLDSDIADTTIDHLIAKYNWEEGVHFEAADGPIYLRDSIVCANHKAGVAGRDADNINLLLSVGPDKHGLIPDKYISALQRLRANLDKLGI